MHFLILNIDISSKKEKNTNNKDNPNWVLKNLYVATNNSTYII